MKPSEVIRIWMMDPCYDPELIKLSDGEHTAYLCNVSCHSGLAGGMSGYDARETRRLIEKKLIELTEQLGKRVAVLNHYFEYRNIKQTLENSREFWESFAQELEAQGK